jgi:hypothetical protein
LLFGGRYDRYGDPGIWGQDAGGRPTVSGETERDVSGWTTDTLKAHFDTLRAADLKTIDQRFTSAEEAVHRALESADKASTKADNATEKRFEGVNEFRATLSDQATRLIPRAEVEQIVKGLNDKIEDLRGTRRAGVASIGALVVGVAVVAAVIAQVIVLVLRG